MTFNERHRKKSSILQVDRQWYGPPVLWTRDDASGAWQPTTDYPPGAPDAPTLDEAAAVSAAAAAEPLAGVKLVAAAVVEAANGGGATPEPGAGVAAGPANGGGAAAGGRRGRSARASLTPAAASAAATPPAAATPTPAAKKRGGAAAAAKRGGKASAPSDLDPPSAAPLKLEEFEAALQSCLCLVDVDIPLVALTDGVHSRSFAGNGLVVFQGDNVGLVLVDRNTVAIG